jgi:hypothetical protein
MKKNIMTFGRGKYDDREVTVADFVSNGLSGFNYERDTVEMVVAESDNIVMALSRLLSLLESRGNLSQADVFWIVNNYLPSSEE